MDWVKSGVCIKWLSVMLPTRFDFNSQGLTVFLNHKAKVGLGILAVLTFNTAFSESSENVNFDSDCNSLDFSLNSVPSTVLVGTDVVEFATFNPVRKALSGSYASEMGGANLSLTIIDETKLSFIKRTFQEPGEHQITSDFYPLCQREATFLAGGMKGYVVENGLLVLEPETKVKSMLSDLWVFYKAVH